MRNTKTAFNAFLLILIISASGCIGGPSGPKTQRDGIIIVSGDMNNYEIRSNNLDKYVCYWVVDQNGTVLTNRGDAAKVFITQIGVELAYTSHAFSGGVNKIIDLRSNVMPLFDEIVNNQIDKPLVKDARYVSIFKGLKKLNKRIANNKLLKTKFLAILSALDEIMGESELTYTSNNYTQSKTFINKFGTYGIGAYFVSESEILTAGTLLAPTFIKYANSTIIDSAVKEFKQKSGEVPFADSLENAIMLAINEDGKLCIGMEDN